MGFAPSATIAQGIAELACHIQPDDGVQLVRFGEVSPSQLPVISVMMDDVWAIDVREAAAQEKPHGALVVERAAERWADMGLGEHKKTRVEVQAGGGAGVVCGPGPPLDRLGGPQASDALGAGLRLLTRMRPSLRSMERIVVELGFVASPRPCLGSCFEAVYLELQEAREGRRGTMFWTLGVHIEVMMSLSLLPFATLDIREEFSGRVVARDTSLGGHGYNHCRVPSAEARAWTRNAIFKGEYTHLAPEEWRKTPRR